MEEKRLPPRPPSPPRPVPLITRRPETDYLVGKYACHYAFFFSLCTSEVDGDLAMGLDVEGDETGSSTDTDTD